MAHRRCRQGCVGLCIMMMYDSRIWSSSEEDAGEADEALAEAEVFAEARTRSHGIGVIVVLFGHLADMEVHRATTSGWCSLLSRKTAM